MLEPLAATLLAAALLGAALAGCGSGDGANPSADSSPSSQRVTTVVGSAQTPQEAAVQAQHRSAAPGPGPDLAPLRPREFERPIAAYRGYAEHQARRMAASVARLRSALAAGNLGSARAAWLDSYDDYLLLGAAYGALGELDEQIDGNPGRLPGGVHDPEFSGLHRLEYGLWSGESKRSLRAPAARLAADVAKLPRRLASLEITPLDYATRAHEILEDAQRDMLSGVDAPWSGSGLRATADAAAATEEVMKTLRPLLAGRGDGLGPVWIEMKEFQRVLAAVRREHGGRWPRLEAMSQGEHERVDGALGALLERLATLPGALETEPTPTIPTIEAQEQ